MIDDREDMFDEREDTYMFDDKEAICNPMHFMVTGLAVTIRAHINLLKTIQIRSQY